MCLNVFSDLSVFRISILNATYRFATIITTSGKYAISMCMHMCVHITGQILTQAISRHLGRQARLSTPTKPRSAGGGA